MSILHSIYSYLRGGGEPDNKYKLVGGNDGNDTGDSTVRYSERPSSHSACRSSNQHRLVTYQSRIDNLKPDQIVYVNLNYGKKKYGDFLIKLSFFVFCLKRTFVPDDKVSWHVKWPEYKPIEYTAGKLLKDKPTWADGENPLDIKNWNRLDSVIDRRSHMGPYEVTTTLTLNPLNPEITMFCVYFFGGISHFGENKRNNKKSLY